MKLAIFALLVACATAASVFDVTLDTHWENFKLVHGKKYQHSLEETLRRLTWESNLKYVDQHNAEAESGIHTFTLKMNKYGDMVRRRLNKNKNRLFLILIFLANN